MKTKTKNLLYLILGIAIVSYLFTAQIYGRKRERIIFNAFYKSELKGIIKNIEIKYHGTGLTLNSDSNEFVFFPITDKINENNIFNQIAKKGDSIIKSQYHDTLILLHGKKEFHYTFQKFK